MSLPSHESGPMSSCSTTMAPSAQRRRRRGCSGGDGAGWRRRSAAMAATVLLIGATNATALGVHQARREKPALAWTAVQQTMYAGELLGETSPRPTSAPELERRGFADIKTCGLESGMGVYLTCSDGFACTNVGSYRGCCAVLGGDADCAANINTACVDYNSSLVGGCNSIGLQTQCCGVSTKGSCFTWLFTPFNSPGVTLTEWQCRAETGVGILIDDSLTPTTSTSTSSSSSVSPTSPGAATTTTDSTTSSSSTATGTPVPATGGGAPVGAIVGGAVGGVAVIGLLGIGALVLYRRNHRDKPNPSMTNGGASGAYPPYPGAQPPPGGYMHHGVPPQAPSDYYAPSSASPGTTAASPYTAMVAYPTANGGYPPGEDPKNYAQHHAGAYDPNRVSPGPPGMVPQQHQGYYAQQQPQPGVMMAPGQGYPVQQQHHSAELDGNIALGSAGNRAELRG